MISTRHEVFFTVAQQKSFSKASQVLYISQPAISRHIRSLEDYYKTQLFNRKGVHIELTPAGKLLFEKLAEVKRIQEQTEFEISGIRDVMQAKGVLKLGASTTVALYILPKVLSSFNQHYPQIHISLLNRNAELVMEALLNGDIDLGIIEGRSKLTQVDYQPFLSDEVVAVCSKKSPIAKKKSYAIQDIKQMPLAIRERGSGTLAALKYALEKHKIKLTDLNIKVRLGGTEALKNFLIESDSLGFLPHRSVMKELTWGELTLVHFEKLHIERDFYFVQRKGENSGLSKSFIKLALNIHNL
ncbi:MAG: LysR family transcriptional regulator [Chitinophagaceae bacterium]|nr:LysR family transcriptional regulator [Chitinophagaceae bacterium]MCA6457213.1 LysR family transcriptional regulator [Chitinophagaceae bacterium]MCA6457924.1 LysR family transcriptional regulator [Chitinophagaceae bacterium]MCA6463637.1 LysR family transcriptional regulator [Chitinophagaceae bacterium]MEA3427019.1 LysR family transcriptional regulator [Bacteroidota bacterium]